MSNPFTREPLFAPLPSCQPPSDLAEVGAAICAIVSAAPEKKPDESGSVKTSLPWADLVKRLCAAGHDVGASEWALYLTSEWDLIGATRPLMTSPTGQVTRMGWMASLRPALWAWVESHKWDLRAATNAIQAGMLKLKQRADFLTAVGLPDAPSAEVVDRFAEFAVKPRKLLQFLDGKEKVSLAAAFRAVHGRKAFTQKARRSFLSLVGRTKALLPSKGHKLTIELGGDTLQMIST